MQSDNDVAVMKTIIKAFETLEVLTQKPEWELGELCERLPLPKTTVHRIIVTLEKLGYVSQEKRRGTYSLTSKLFKMGSSAINHTGLVDMARQDCHHLLDEVEETVNLCIPNETEMLVVDIQVSPHPLRQATHIGTGFEMIRSASGRAYLAFLPDSEKKELLSRIRSQGEFSDEEWKALLAELDEVRQTGVGYDNEEIFTGVKCLAAPVFNHQSNVIASISISAPIIRLNDEKIKTAVFAVRETAARISSKLGAPNTPFMNQK